MSTHHSTLRPLGAEGGISDMFLCLFVSSTVHLVCSFVLILGSHSDNLHTLFPRDLRVL